MSAGYHAPLWPLGISKISAPPPLVIIGACAMLTQQAKPIAMLVQIAKPIAVLTQRPC